jgi:hypothetical protein
LKFYHSCWTRFSWPSGLKETFVPLKNIHNTLHQDISYLLFPTYLVVQLLQSYLISLASPQASWGFLPVSPIQVCFLPMSPIQWLANSRKSKSERKIWIFNYTKFYCNPKDNRGSFPQQRVSAQQAELRQAFHTRVMMIHHNALLLQIHHP